MKVPISVKATVAIGIAFLVAVWPISGQAQVSGTKPNLVPPDSLVVFGKVEDVRHLSDYSGVTTYELSDPSPKERLASEFNRRLMGAGWKLATDPFNPHSPSNSDWNVSTVQGRWSLGWAGHWADNMGNMVSVNLKYDLVQRGTSREASLPVHVTIVRLDRKMAEALKKIR